MAKILVIDDDQQLLHMVGLMLERGGHSITLISKPEQGLEKLQTEKPDLLVVDVMMPNMSGHDLTRRVRATEGLEDLPILVLTARSQDIDRDTALRSGANGYLSKPVTSQELIEQVDKLLNETTQAKKKSAMPGMILTFLGLRGGVGKTTLATNLALALRKISNREVCLVDFSPSVGQIIYHLNVKTQADWSQLLTEESLTWDAIKESLALHPSGLRVLAAPPQPDSPDVLAADTVQQLLSLLKSHMTFVVVDLPPFIGPIFWTTLNMTDVGLHVVTPDVISVRTAVQTERTIANADVKIKQKSFVLNQVAEKAQLPDSAVERGLNGRIPFQIAFDPNQAKAMIQGNPLVATTAQSPLPTVLNRMAQVIWKRMAAKIKA